jgi:tape measure domain-containing protein
MTTERIDIIVTDRINPNVSRKLSMIGNSASKADKSLSLFSKRLLTIGAIIQASRAFIKLSDNFTLIENKIRNVTDSMEDMEFVTRRVFETANRTRTSVAATTQAFQRFDLALAKTGASQQEVLRLTETLNKAMILGGATAQEQTSGLLQLSQAFNEGVLRGQEFRIISQTMPVVLEKIAEQLGVTRGELKKMGSQGKLTIDVLRTAIGGLEKDIDERFAKTVPTIAQSWTVFTNRATQAIGLINKELGPASGLSRSIMWLGDTLKSFVEFSVAAFLLFKESAIVTIDIIRERWGDGISKWWKQVKDGFDALLDITKFFANAIIGTMVGIVNTVITAWDLLPKAATDVLKMVNNAFVNGTEAVWNVLIKGVNLVSGVFEDFFDGAINLALNSFDAIKAIWGNLSNVFKRAFQLASNSAIDIVEKMTNGVIETLKGLFIYIDDASEALGGERLFDNLLGDVDLSSYKVQVEKDVGSLMQTIKDIFNKTDVDFIGDTLKIDEMDLSNLLMETSGAFGQIGQIASEAFKASFGVDFVGEFVSNIEAVIDRVNEETGKFRDTQKTEANLWADIWGEAAKKNLNHMSTFWGNLATLQESSSKKLQRVGKAAAITQATIDTYRSANAAFADTPGNVFIRSAAAAAAVAAGLVNVQNIANAGNFANGGIVGGSSFSGDNVQANVNSGEMILNRQQQSQLFRMANGGATTGGGAVNISIENYGSSKDFEVQQMSETDIRVIARDVATQTVQRDAPGVIAGDISNPNGRVSRSLATNTDIQRRR